MTRSSLWLKALALGASAAALAAGNPALAQTGTPTAAATAEPGGAMADLVRLLVKKGSITQEEGDLLIAKSAAELVAARAQGAASAVASAAPPPEPGEVSVPYVPQLVRDQIRDQIREQVLAQAKAERWAAPNAVPDWTSRIRLFGDLRVRAEGRYYDKDNRANLVDFIAINAGPGYDVSTSNPDFPAIQNSLADRQLLRLRARFGLEAQLGGGLSTTIRVATGSDNSPVSTTQTLGGYLSKKNLWLDRGYLSYRQGDALQVNLGRTDNPFIESNAAFATSDIVWDEDTALDGITATARYSPSKSLKLRADLAGVTLNFAPDGFPDQATADQKVSSSQNSYLVGGQVAATYQVNSAVNASLSAAVYGYYNVTGKVASQCLNTGPYCATDYSRPGFMQKGNTLVQLRDFVIPDPTSNRQLQYFGYASQFRDLSVKGAVSYLFKDDVHASLTGNYVHNFGYDRNVVMNRGVIVTNNDGCSVQVPLGQPCPVSNQIFRSGADAYMARFEIGRTSFSKKGDWLGFAEYRYIQPDAVLDAFNDSDFHLGGTNAKGYVVGGAYGLTDNFSVGARWLSANTVYGAPLSIDVLQLDLSGKF
ncbi:putative porin [Sphingomonas sp. KR3-1]|uniref:putative porin n=1 Tax=Sphingomonas sp. KR3-1 TaxID=3156611 RepID=UPI0032B40D4D